ncbi:MAG TPA: hypothetical protein VET86_07320 [Casimicrobiaceae bacterium]|nr:hypothetical protein [Casimicrobiaceae bacterium]
MSAPSPPALLASLRARAEALRGDELALRRSAADAMREIDRRLHAAYRWFEEILAHLDVIRPAIDRRYAVDRALTIARPRYAGGAVSLRRARRHGCDMIECVEVGYRMSCDAPIRIVAAGGAVRMLAERLRAAQIAFDYRVEAPGARGGVLTVTPELCASVRLGHSPAGRTIVVTLANVDRLETVALEFEAEALGEAALEDLVRLMLGESDAFLRRAPLAGLGGSRR